MYKVLFKEGTYQIVKQGMPVHTPAGSKVETASAALAERLRDHFNELGTSNDNWRAIAHFHFPLLDFVRHYTREEVVMKMVLDLDPYNDWTLRPITLDPELETRRSKLFGQLSEQLAKARAWLTSLNEYQLCAALVLGRDLGSINAAWLAGNLSGKEQEQALINSLPLFRPELGSRPLQELLDNFHFYRSLRE